MGHGQQIFFVPVLKVTLNQIIVKGPSKYNTVRFGEAGKIFFFQSSPQLHHLCREAKGDKRKVCRKCQEKEHPDGAGEIVAFFTFLFFSVCKTGPFYLKFGAFLLNVIFKVLHSIQILLPQRKQSQWLLITLHPASVWLRGGKVTSFLKTERTLCQEKQFTLVTCIVRVFVDAVCLQSLGWRASVM